MLFSLALLCLASTALCSPETGIRPGKERVKKDDDLTLGDLQRLVQQQASTINRLQARLTASENHLNSMGNQLQGINTLQARLTAAENKLSSMGNQVQSINTFQTRLTATENQGNVQQKSIASLGSQLQTMQHVVEVLTKAGEPLTRCPDNWVRFEDSCYVFLNDKVPWGIGKVYCGLFYDSHMLEVTTQKKNDFIAGEMRAKGLSEVWLGLSDLEKKGNWMLNSDHQRATFLHWSHGEPNNSEGVEDCAVVLSNGYWNDLPCTSNRRTTVCEKPVRNGGVVG